MISLSVRCVASVWLILISQSFNQHSVHFFGILWWMGSIWKFSNDRWWSTFREYFLLCWLVWGLSNRATAEWNLLATLLRWRREMKGICEEVWSGWVTVRLGEGGESKLCSLETFVLPSGSLSAGWCSVLSGGRRPPTHQGVRLSVQVLHL